MGRCDHCGLESEEIPSSMSVCASCLRKGLFGRVRRSRETWRETVGLPKAVPKGKGLRCTICSNECEIPEGGTGFCGVIGNEGSGLVPITGSFDRALLEWYLDPHPTNCVAGPVCPERGSYGKFNLAVFFIGCNLDCLFCQDIQHKYMLARREGGIAGVRELVEAANDRVTCVCFFGGDPTPYSIFALKASEMIAEKGKRVCWETNGLQNPAIMRRMAELSIRSGGIVKIDWKAWDPNIYSALTGVDGEKAIERLKENVRIVHSLSDGREPPLLVVSTLVVPHYIDAEEVGGIASYLASIDPDIPYVLLAFAPHHLMRGVPTTSREQMSEAVKAAREAGLRRVFVGNWWLLRTSTRPGP